MPSTEFSSTHAMPVPSPTLRPLLCDNKNVSRHHQVLLGGRGGDKSAHKCENDPADNLHSPEVQKLKNTPRADITHI